MANGGGTPTTARIPLLAENAALLSNRIEGAAAAGASTIEVVRSECRPACDPLVHFSDEYLAHVRMDCITAARHAGVCLEWRLPGAARFDFRGCEPEPAAANRLRRLPMSPVTDYRNLIGRLHSLVEAALQPRATSLVVTKGDDALLPPASVAWHFPQADGGEWAGYHPASSTAAVDELERLRAVGADHLILPRTVFWWFGHYAALVEHLTTKYVSRVEEEQTCVIFDLRSTSSAPGRTAVNGAANGGARNPRRQPPATRERTARENGSRRKTVRISLDERIATERRNLLLREAALIAGRTELPGPYEAHVGFSNFCNMSCIMCWNGANPPLRRMSRELLEKLADRFAPSLSVITPYDGSEPLVASWDETRTLCEEYSIDLCLTTNVQFLDEAKFREVERVAETLFLSIDSHDRELFQKIRPRSKPERVFRNLRTTAQLARESGLECLANIVFMAENAPLLPETVTHLADEGIESVHVLQLLDVNGQSGLSDPLIHFSREYIDWIRERCVDVARRRRIRLYWDVAGGENHDFRPPDAVPPTPRKVRYDHWDWRMKHYVPGYCRYVYDRLRITVNGAVAPCSYSVGGQLELGSLSDQSFDEIWNGPKAQDLRRAHSTWDYPTNCVTCRLKEPIGPARKLPFIDSFHDTIGTDPETVERTLVPLGPAHMTRTAKAPTFQIHSHDDDIVSYCLVMGLGGETDHFIVHSSQPGAAKDGVVGFELSPRQWEWLLPNLGYWWVVFGFSADTTLPQRVVRSSELRCVIRHVARPRIEESGLQYPDEQHLPSIDLGAAKELGWTEPGKLPGRPQIVRRRGF